MSEGTQMTTCAYCCRSCGGHFTSLEAFDAHRSGPFDGERVCSYPDDASLIELTGTCKIVAGPPQVGVTVYEHERAGKLRDYRQAQNARPTRSTDAKRAA